MSDPFLFGPPTAEAPEPTEQTASASYAEPESDLRRILLEAGLAEDDVEQHLQQGNQRLARWEPLADAIACTLIDAGFHQHDPRNAGGGFHIACHLRDDGVLVSWALRGRLIATAEIAPYETAVEHIMNPALRDVLTAAGYTTHLIPDDHDYAGFVLVTAGPSTN